MDSLSDTQTNWFYNLSNAVCHTNELNALQIANIHRSSPNLPPR